MRRGERVVRGDERARPRSASNSGKSVIQQNCQPSLPRSCGIELQLAGDVQAEPPSTALTSFLAPNWRNSRSPSPSAGAPALIARAQLVGHRLHRALRPDAALADARAREAARAEALGELLQLVEIGARQRLGVRGGQAPALDDAARRVDGRLQQADAAAVVARDDVGQIDERQPEAEVGLVEPYFSIASA